MGTLPSQVATNGGGGLYVLCNAALSGAASVTHSPSPPSPSMEDRLLEEQLARLRGSWSRESHDSHAANEISTRACAGSTAAPPLTGVEVRRQWLAGPEAQHAADSMHRRLDICQHQPQELAHGSSWSRQHSIGDERRFVCQAQGCDKAYATSTGLSQHMRVKHPQSSEFSFLCQAQGCDKAFATSTGLSQHMRVMHPWLSKSVGVVALAWPFGPSHVPLRATTSLGAPKRSAPPSPWYPEYLAPEEPLGKRACLGNGEQVAQLARAYVDTPSRETTTPPGTLQERFAQHVMCDYTPIRPSELHKSLWVSCEQLVTLLQPHAPEEVRRLGHENLKQLITEWHKDHPAFADLPFSAWCKKLKDRGNPHAARRSSIHFSFRLSY